MRTGQTCPLLPALFTGEPPLKPCFARGTVRLSVRLCCPVCGCRTSSFWPRQTARELQASTANRTLPHPPGAQQVAKAVNSATQQSLVLIDEFGKGTNTVREETDEDLRRGNGGGQRGSSGRLDLRSRVGLCGQEGSGEARDGKGQGRGGTWALMALPPHPVLCTGGWARTSGRCAPTLAGTWTHVSPHLCGHQLSEPRSATAAATGAPCAVFGEETNLVPWNP